QVRGGGARPDARAGAGVDAWSAMASAAPPPDIRAGASDLRPGVPGRNTAARSRGNRGRFAREARPPPLRRDAALDASSGPRLARADGRTRPPHPDARP